MNSDSSSDDRSVSDRFNTFLTRFMAVDGLEWEAIHSNPRLAAEIRFHAIAILFSAMFFGFAIYNISVSLLRQPTLGALVFASMAAFGLGAIDRYVRVQSRGTPESMRSIVYKVRAASMSLVTISAVFMGAHAFGDDIDRQMTDIARERRTALEASPRYAERLSSIRQELELASKATSRAAELGQVIPSLRVALAKAQEEYTNECEGNTTGQRTRARGCDAIARGHDAAAKRVQKEIAAAEHELAQVHPVANRLAAARSDLAELDREISEEVARTLKGSFERLEVWFSLLASKVTAMLTVPFWIAVGLIPEALIWIALGRSPNDELFQKIRAVQIEASSAAFARLRSELRNRDAARDTPLEFRPHTPPTIASSSLRAEANSSTGTSEKSAAWGNAK